MISFLGLTLTTFMTWSVAHLKCTYEELQEKSQVLTDEEYNNLDETLKVVTCYCWLSPPEFTNKENSRNHPVPKSNIMKLLQHEAVFWESENPKSLIILNLLLHSFFPAINYKQIIK